MNAHAVEALAIVSALMYVIFFACLIFMGILWLTGVEVPANYARAAAIGTSGFMVLTVLTFMDPFGPKDR